MKLFKVILVLFAVVLTANVSFGGPLRNWIIEKRASNNQDDSGEDDNSSSGKAALPRGVKLVSDIAYGPDEKQRMDVYIPALAKGAPVIFMVHGGAWRAGDKAASGVIENKVARWVPKGIIFISTNYRLLPDADPLVQADDVALAIKKAQTDAEKWGGDPAKFILMGHSAGAHIVSLVSSNSSKIFGSGVAPWLGTVSLDSAAYDIVEIMRSKHYRFYDNAFGKNPVFWKSASPFHALSSEAKPLLAVCSGIRPDAPCSQARKFSEKAASIGVIVEVSEQNMSHAQINKNLGAPGVYTDSVEVFMGSLDAKVKKMLSGKGAI